MNIQKKRLEDLRPAAYNPRKNLRPQDKEWQKIARSIEEFGYIDPIICNKDGTIIGGHQRYKVLKALGYTEIDCVEVDLDKDREKALNIALNKISGDWDEDRLKDLLAELDASSLDPELTGFDLAEIDELLGQFVNPADVTEDNPPDPPKVPTTKPGDLWILGRHRLLCGDATRAEDMAKLMGVRTAEMVFTDPPYNVGLGYNETPEEAKARKRRTDGLTVENDDMDDEEFYEFLKTAFDLMLRHTDKGGAIYICHADTRGLTFRQAVGDAGWMIKQCIIWAKDRLALSRQDYQWQHEPILYGWRPGAAHRWYRDRKQTTLWEDAVAAVLEDRGDGTQKITISNGIQQAVLKVTGPVEVLYSGDDSDRTIWRFEKPSRSEKHPTMKPVALVARALTNSSKRGQIVLDPFGGSGSTLIAAEKTGRVCYTMELDPKYCDVIVERWENLTGRAAERREG
jgi:DNA modification methylase